MPPDPFDRASRYLVQRSPGAMLGWLLGLGEGRGDFVQWLDTRRIPWPGSPDRACDTVAWLRDPDRGGLPFAAVLEFQLRPDAEMFGRLLVYLGSVWLECRPSPLPGDRFCLAAAVVNLTGRGNSGREMAWEAAGVEVTLRVREWNLGELEAVRVLDDVAAGRAPRPALAWIPLMQGGGEDAIIQRWLGLARQEEDSRRADLGLARVFAEAAGCRDVWDRALEGWNVAESNVVKEWIGMGEMRGKAEAVLELLTARLGPVPADLNTAIREAKDLAALRRLLLLAAQAGSIDQFRHDAGL